MFQALVCIGCLFCLFSVVLFSDAHSFLSFVRSSFFQNIFRHFEQSGTINDMTVKELKSIKYLSTPHSTSGHPTVIDPNFIESERMPTLEEVVRLLEKEAPHMKMMIEVKERANVKGMCQALKNMYATNKWMYDRCFVASFNPFILYQLRRIDPDIVTSFLFIDNWSSHLLKNARDVRIEIPFWLKYNYPLHWILDDVIWSLGTSVIGLSCLGANLSACEVKALTHAQIRYERENGIITSTWVANNEQQKEWLLQQGVSDNTHTHTQPTICDLPCVDECAPRCE